MARFQSKLVAEKFVSVFLILQKTLTSSFDAERVVMNIMMWRSSSFCQKRRPRWYSARHPLLILCRGVHLRCHYWPKLHSAGISQQWTRRRFLLVLRSLYLLSSFPPHMTSFYPLPTSFYPLPTSFFPLPTSIPSFTCPRMQVKDEGFLRDDVTDVSVAVCIVSIFEFVRVLLWARVCVHQHVTGVIVHQTWGFVFRHSYDYHIIINSFITIFRQRERWEKKRRKWETSSCISQKDICFPKANRKKDNCTKK